MDDCHELVDSLQAATGLVTTIPVVCFWFEGSKTQVQLMRLKVTKTNDSLGEALVVVQILLFTGFERTQEVQQLLGCLQYIDKTTRND